MNVVGFFFKEPWIKKGEIDLDKIPFHSLTHIPWAFFIPQKNGVIQSTNSKFDDRNLPQFAERAHLFDTKVLMAVGGWTGSDNFPILAAHKESRDRFIESAIATITKYNLDGIDIDWEYPKYTPHGGTSKDGENLQKLLRDLKKAFKQNSKKLILTMDLPANPNILSNYPLKGLQHHCDFISIMTYDYHFPMKNANQYIGHNSPLKNHPEDPENLSIESTFNFLQNENLDFSAINLGIPFYGHAFKNQDGLFSKHENSGCEEESGGYSFAQIHKKITTDEWFTQWDEISETAFIQTENEWISYDNPLSVSKKIDFAYEKGLAGCIIWEIMGDYVAEEGHPLLDSIIHSIKSSMPRELKIAQLNNPSFV
jgi:chitinase